MSGQTNSIGYMDSTVHTIKGTGWCLGTSVVSLALVTTAIIATTTVVTLFAMDGFFIYSVDMTRPVGLLWAVPVALTFLVLDILVAMRIVELAQKAIAYLTSMIKKCRDQTVYHFRQVRVPY